jgi:elongation factor G
MGDILGDLSARRGKIGGMTQRGEAQVIAASVPLSEMFGYSTSLRSLTQGRGAFSMEPARYAPLPPEVRERVVGA